MPVAYIQEFAIKDRATTNYDFVKERIGEGPFDGLLIHSAGFDEEDGVFRILDIWETREHAERFLAEHVQPLIDEGPSAFPDPRCVRHAVAGRLLRVARRRAAGTRTSLRRLRGRSRRGIAPTSRRNVYRVMRIATSYFDTDVRSPGVSSRGIASRISLPRA